VRSFEDPKSCPLKPGTYAAAPFEPGFTFTIGDGWSNHADDAGAGEIRRDPKTGLGWASNVREQGDKGLTTADALFDVIVAMPQVTSTDPVPVTIGGIAGQAIDVTVGPGGQIFFMSGPKSETTGWAFSPGYKVRMMALDVSGTLVLFMVDVSPAKDFATQMAIVQPVLDSIVWQ
jgi:hypothetical protein